MSDIKSLISYLREKNFIDETVAETIIKCNSAEINEQEFTEQIGELIAAVDRYKQNPKNQEYFNDVTYALGYFEELAGDKKRLEEYGFIQPTDIVSLDDISLEPIVNPFEEEEEESQISNQQTNNEVNNNIFPDSKYNMNVEIGDFEPSVLFEEDTDINPYEDAKLEESTIGEANKKVKKIYDYKASSAVDEEYENNLNRTYAELRGKKKHYVKPSRAGKIFDVIDEKIKEFGVDDIREKQEVDISKHRKHFLDLIINGNFRIKYIPNTATRDLAEKYAEHHLDENGLPSYRVLPTNAIDPLGQAITDLNGDRVEDIVLVDRKGIPVIVNGYKLVQASPYKKVWATKFNTRAARKEKPFNDWLYEEFNKNITNVDWKEGKWNTLASEEMNTLISAYQGVGLPKPRIGKRLSPQSFWSSVFSYMWKLFWKLPEFIPFLPLKTLVKYISAANVMFCIYFDIPTKKALEQQTLGGKQLPYKNWIVWKGVHKTEYNQYVGNMLNEFVNNDLSTIVDLKTMQLNKESSKQWSKQIKDMLGMLTLVVFGYHLNYDYNKEEDKQKIGALAEAVLHKTVDKKRLLPLINSNVTRVIEDLYGGSGYSQYKEQMNAEKLEKKNKMLEAYNTTYKLKPNH